MYHCMLKIKNKIYTALNLLLMSLNNKGEEMPKSAMTAHYTIMPPVGFHSNYSHDLLSSEFKKLLALLYLKLLSLRFTLKFKAKYD